MEPTDEEKAESALWGFNPESRRYVLRQGSTWRKLIIRGVVKDPEMQKRWTDNREALRQRQIEAAKAARILGFGIEVECAKSHLRERSLQRKPSKAQLLKMISHLKKFPYRLQHQKKTHVTH